MSLSLDERDDSSQVDRRSQKESLQELIFLTVTYKTPHQLYIVIIKPPYHVFLDHLTTFGSFSPQTSPIDFFFFY